MICGVVVPVVRADAQGTATIRGEVVHVDGVTRAAGVVVVAKDATGTEVARALSGSAGNFLLTVHAPARYVVKALRIGYRPTLLAPIDVAEGEARTLHIVLSGEGVSLEAVRVEGATTCRIAEETGRLIVNVWDQARTALVASTMSSGGRPFTATLATYRQYTPIGDRVIAAETIAVTRQATTTGFVSVPAETLADSGYVVLSGSQISYHAPDANVLLSPSFAGTHCFSVRPGGAAHPDWIGISFKPAVVRPGISDVDGTLWLDRASAELRELEFRYVNLPRNSGWEDADGSVHFMRLVTGDWIIRRWSIRTPVTEQRVGGGLPTRFVPIARRVVGGITRSIERDGIIAFTDPGASLTLALRARDGVNTGGGAYGGLLQTEHDARGDSVGTIRLTGLASGRYRAVVWTPFMSWIEARPVERDVDVEFDAPRTMDIELPTAEDLAAQRCRIGVTGGARLAYGVVTRGNRAPVPGARLAFSWTVTSQAFVGRRRVPQSTPFSQVATADAGGRWSACLPSATSMDMTVTVDDAVATRRVLRLPGGRYLERVDFEIP